MAEDTASQSARVQESRLAHGVHTSARETVHTVTSSVRAAHHTNTAIRDITGVSASEVHSGAKSVGVHVHDSQAQARSLVSLRSSLLKPGTPARGLPGGSHVRQAGQSSAGYARDMVALDRKSASRVYDRLLHGRNNTLLPKQLGKLGLKHAGRLGTGTVGSVVQAGASGDEDLSRIVQTGDASIAGVRQANSLATGSVNRSMRFGSRLARPRRTMRAAKQRAAALKRQSRALRTAGQNVRGLRRIRFAWRASIKNMQAVYALAGGAVIVLIVVLMILGVVGMFVLGGSMASQSCDQDDDGGGVVSAAGFGAKTGQLGGLKLTGRTVGRYQLIDPGKMGIRRSDFDGASYPQCTWWVKVRLAQLGIPKYGAAGDGRNVADHLINVAGWKRVNPGMHAIRIGDVVSYQPGALGAVAGYGHVDLVEKVSDGNPNTMWTSDGNMSKAYTDPVLLQHGGDFYRLWKAGRITVARYTGGHEKTMSDTDSPSVVSASCPVDGGVLAGGDVKPATAGDHKKYQDYARSQFTRFGWEDSESGSNFQALIRLWTQESGWNPGAVNASSGACGIVQALPCSKIGSPAQQKDYKAQIDWGLVYIKNRYGTPVGAWRHEVSYHWY